MKQWILVLVGLVFFGLARAQNVCPAVPLAGVSNELTTGFPEALADPVRRESIANNVKARLETDYYDQKIGRQDWSTWIRRAMQATNERAYYDVLREWLGSLNKQDNFSEFYSSRQIAAFNTPTPPRTGLGYTTNSSGQSYVMRITPGSPAEQAGVKLRDRVLAVDGDTCLATTKFQGQAGSVVRVRLQTAGEPVREVSITRAIPPQVIPPWVSKRLPQENAVGYLWLPFFNQANAITLAETLESLQSGAGLKGLVLDLRGGLDGSSRDMDAMLGHFVQGLQYQFVNGDATLSNIIPRSIAQRQPDLSQLPLAVLVDSSSYILATWAAGILQRRAKTVVVGQPSKPFPIAGRSFSFADDSEFDIPTIRFEFPDRSTLPEGRTVPTVLVQENWLEYSEANDPYIRAALEALSKLK